MADRADVDRKLAELSNLSGRRIHALLIDRGMTRAVGEEETVDLGVRP